MLILKHFIVDFILQTPYQYENKGTYMHPGGVLHAALHGTFSFVLLLPIILTSTSITTLLIVSIIDAILHYHIDYGKMTLNKALNLTPKDQLFWTIMGFDQLLHYLTYVGMVLFILRSI
jgi:hypothetical protein